MPHISTQALSQPSGFLLQGWWDYSAVLLPQSLLITLNLEEPHSMEYIKVLSFALMIE